MRGASVRSASMHGHSEILPRSAAPFRERRPATTTVERVRTGALADVLPFQVRDRFPSRSRGTLELSIVAPVYDEEENLERLHARIVEVFGDRTRWELILVDDGSRDR